MFLKKMIEIKQIVAAESRFVADRAKQPAEFYARQRAGPAFFPAASVLRRHECGDWRPVHTVPANAECKYGFQVPQQVVGRRWVLVAHFVQ